MFVLNTFIASLIFFLFKGAYAVLGHEAFTVGTRYGNHGHRSEMPVSDAFLPYYIGFLILMGIFFFVSILWYNKQKAQEGQLEEDKGLRNLDSIVVSLFIASITPVFIMVIMFQNQVSGMFYGMIFLLLMLELYFGRTSTKTLMLSLLLLYLGTGTEYTFILNGAGIFLIVAVASRLARSLYGEPVIRDSIAS